MKRHLNILPIILLVVLISGCWSVRYLDDYTLYRKTVAVDRNILRTDGVYYTVTNSDKVPRVECFVLYQDGTYYNLVTHISNNVEDALGSILKYHREHHAKLSNQLIFWGAFEIFTDTLHVQGFRSSADSEVYFTQVYDYKLRIVNDSTLVEIQTPYPRDKVRQFHFYRIDNKPDSTNLFMTNEKMRKRLERKH
jgi:hypothetical protein